MLRQIFFQIQNFFNNIGLGAEWNKYMGLYFSELGAFKAISILLTALFVGLTLYFMIFTNWLPLRIDRVRDVIIKTNLSKKRSIKAWKRVERHFFAGDDNSLKLAIIDADNTLNEALRLAGFRGENLGDRLKKIDESQMPNVQDLWEAHKLRNRIAHEPDFKINREIAEKALTIYENTFRDLGLLD